MIIAHYLAARGHQSSPSGDVAIRGPDAWRLPMTRTVV